MRDRSGAMAPLPCRFSRTGCAPINERHPTHEKRAARATRLLRPGCPFSPYLSGEGLAEATFCAVRGAVAGQVAVFFFFEHVAVRAATASALPRR